MVKGRSGIATRCQCNAFVRIVERPILDGAEGGPWKHALSEVEESSLFRARRKYWLERIDSLEIGKQCIMESLSMPS